VTARDPLDVEAYAAELAKVVIGELKPISQPIEIRDYDTDWNSPAGRWFLSMYSNASDEVKNRHTGKPAKLDLKGVRP